MFQDPDDYGKLDQNVTIRLASADYCRIMVTFRFLSADPIPYELLLLVLDLPSPGFLLGSLRDRSARYIDLSQPMLHTL